MIITSLITEYNPFHNGHIHHIEASRRLTGADVVIAIMSGSFTQRGGSDHIVFGSESGDIIHSNSNTPVIIAD